MKKFEIPGFFNPKNADQVYRVPYQNITEDAANYRDKNKVANASGDALKVALMPIDVQNTFCIPGYELFVQGAPDDNIRLAKFIYENLGRITKIFPTMDTHTLLQIFHPLFFVDANGKVVPPMTFVTSQALKDGSIQVNPAAATNLGWSYTHLVQHVTHYVEKLEQKSKYSLTVWPYHAMLTGIGHALVSIVDEAITFHSIARNSTPGIEIKGGNPFTENYSVLSPEVLTTFNGTNVAQRNTKFIETLLNYDVVIITGQAKSHCVAWTIDDLLQDIAAKDPSLAKKVYLIEDCTSPVIVPGIVDYTQEANDAFARFAAAGMNIVQSTLPMDQWPGLDAKKLV